MLVVGEGGAGTAPFGTSVPLAADPEAVVVETRQWAGAWINTAQQAGVPDEAGLIFCMYAFGQIPMSRQTCSHLSLLVKCFVNMSAAITSETQSWRLTYGAKDPFVDPAYRNTMRAPNVAQRRSTTRRHDSGRGLVVLVDFQ